MVTKIAYFVNQYPKVSHTFIRREIAGLERQGFEIERFALRGWEAALVDEEDQREQMRTHYVLRDGWLPLLAAAVRAFLRMPWRFWHALATAFRMGWRADRPAPFHVAYLLEACRLGELLRLCGAQHVHAHFGTNSAEVVMLTRVLGGPSYSFTVHGPEEFEKAPTLYLQDKIAGASFVVAVSEYGGNELRRWTREADWPKIKVVHCGLDLTCYRPESTAGTPARLVCVGRICEQKAQLLLIETFARVVERGIDAELVLVGDGELRPDAEALVAERGLIGRVRITGWVDGARVNAELSAARGLIVPSRAEGLPVVIMEAMALQRPVVASRVAGIPELVVHSETGWLVPIGDTRALEQAIEALLCCPDDKLYAMGQRARARVAERHSIDQETKKLAALIRPGFEVA